MNAERQPHSDDRDRVKVGVAEFAVASDGTRVTTSGLGSCVGVAVADPDAGVAGLAHVMLPETDTDRSKPAKSVVQGVERLIAEIEAAGGRAGRFEAKLAGGSRMFDFSGVSEGVGERNVTRSRDALAERNVPVVAEDVGGEHGRSLSLHPGEWTLTVTSARDEVVEL